MEAVAYLVLVEKEVLSQIQDFRYALYILTSPSAQIRKSFNKEATSLISPSRLTFESSVRNYLFLWVASICYLVYKAVAKLTHLVANIGAA